MYIHRVKKGMVRKQVYLTAEQNARLRRAAARDRRTEADILREALDEEQPDPQEDSLWDLVGVGTGDDDDLSERVDEILYGSDES